MAALGYSGRDAEKSYTNPFWKEFKNLPNLGEGIPSPAPAVITTKTIFAICLFVAVLLSNALAENTKAVKDPDCQHPPGAVSKLRIKFEDACFEKNEGAALEVVSKGLLINEEDENKNTPLSLAAQAPMPKVVKRLIEMGGNVNAESDYNTTVLTSAIAGGNTEIVALLLTHGADINHLTKTGYSPLMVAAQRGNPAMVELLLEKGALPTQMRDNGTDSLFLAAANGHAEIIRLLAKAGCNVNSVNSDGDTPLLAACLRGSLTAVQALVDSGVHLNTAAKNRYGMTPVTLAACHKTVNEKQDYAGILRYLILKGAKLDVPDGSGQTAILLAAKVSAVENIRALSAGGVDIKRYEHDVAKAFLEAVHDGRHETVAVFLELGLNPDSCPPESKTELAPLLYAVKVSRDDKMVKLLLDAGSNPNATHRFQPILSGVFVGTPPEPREIEESVLIAAVHSNNPEIVKMLVDAGATADFCDTDGRTALDWARELKRERMIEILSAVPKPSDAGERLKAARQLPVKDPASTPYNNDPLAREVYLEEYRAGYRSVLAVVSIDCHTGIKGPTFGAFQAGWNDGKNVATKDHPEKVAEMLGIPLSDYLRDLRKSGK